MDSMGNAVFDTDEILRTIKTEVISFKDMDENEKKLATSEILDGEEIKQFDMVCQKKLPGNYSKRFFIKSVVDHLLFVKVNRLVVAMAMCTENTMDSRKMLRDGTSAPGIDYMRIEVICTRKYSHLGKHVISAVEQLTLTRGMHYISLATVKGAIGFYERMEYHPLPVTRLRDTGESEKRVILDFLEMAEQLALMKTVPEEDNGFFSNTSVAKVLEGFKFHSSIIEFIVTDHFNEIEEFENKLEKFHISDHFLNGDLVMSKYLMEIDSDSDSESESESESE